MSHRTPVAHIIALGAITLFAGSGRSLADDEPGCIGDPLSVSSIVRVGLADDGSEPMWQTRYPTVSADGRFVAFGSLDPDLVPEDTNNFTDVFVRDILTGEVTRISSSYDGGAANYFSEIATISGDGRFVAFQSYATNIVEGDSNHLEEFEYGGDVFVHDRLTGLTTLASVATDGTQGNRASALPAISHDGRFVAFQSQSTTFVPGAARSQIYVRDRLKGETTCVSVSSAGVIGDADSGGVEMSADGRVVVFASNARNLVPDDTNNVADIFVHDRATGETTRVNLSSTGEQALGFSTLPAISPDGMFVVFQSEAANLVAGDTNGESDVFLHNRATGETTRVSVASDGTQGDKGVIGKPRVSDGGRVVVFIAESHNLIPADFAHDDVLAHVPATGQTIGVTRQPNGIQADRDTGWSVFLTPDGSKVVFWSGARNLVPDDTNNADDVFMAVLAGGPGVLSGDISGDGAVDFADLNTVLTAFGSMGEALPADVNNDGAVDFADLNTVLSTFGQDCR